MDADGDAVTYYKDSSTTCPSVSVSVDGSSISFTAPAKNATCVVAIKAYDGNAYSPPRASTVITGQNNPPNTPAALTCPATPLASATLQTCTLTAASPLDPDSSDTVSYMNSGSTCSDTAVSVLTGAVTFTAPAKGATCSIQLRANDGLANSGAVTSTTITGQNRAPNTPTLSCPASPSAGSTGNTCTLTPATPVDPDSLDSVTYVDAGSSCPATIVDSGNGAITFTAPSAGVSCSIQVKAFDGTAQSSIAAATIGGSNSSPNQPQALACTAHPAANAADQPCTLTPADPADPNGDSVTYSADDSTTCPGVSVHSSGSPITFTAPAAGGSCIVAVRASDGQLSSSAVTSNTITAQNTAPSAPASVSCTANPEAGATGQTCTLVAASPADLNGDPVTYHLDAATTCPASSVSLNGGTITFTAPARNATCVVAIQAHDGSSYSNATTSNTVTGQNTAPNPPPSLSCTTTPLAGATNQTCTLAAANPADPNGDPVTYSADASTTCAGVSVDPSGSPITFTAPGKSASCVVAVKASDGLLSSTAVTSEVITGQNHPPAVPQALSCVTGAAAGTTGQTCTLTPAGTPDPDNDPVQYALAASSTCPSAAVSSDGATITFTAPAKDAECVVAVQAYDGENYSAPVTSNTVIGGNRAPNAPAQVVCTASPFGGATGQACTLSAANPLDPDAGDTVTYADGGSTCAAVVVNGTTGNATFTAPTKGSSCTVKVKAVNGGLDSAGTESNQITARNNPPNTPASITCATSPTAGSTGNTCTITAATPTDPDGDSVTYAKSGSTCTITGIDSTSRTVTFTAPAQGASCSITIKASDGTLDSNTVSSEAITGSAAAVTLNTITLTAPLSGLQSTPETGGYDEWTGEPYTNPAVINAVNVTVTVKENGVAAAGKSVSLVSIRGSVESITGPTPALTDSNGQTTFTLHSFTEGFTQLTATSVAGGESVTAKAYLYFGPTPAAEFRAYLANGTSPGSNDAPVSLFKDLRGSLDGILRNFSYTTSSGWAGDGTFANSLTGGPHRLVFDGVDDYVDFGTAFNSNTNFSAEVWIKFAPNSAGKVLLNNLDPATKTGFRISVGAGNSLTLLIYDTLTTTASCVGAAGVMLTDAWYSIGIREFLSGGKTNYVMTVNGVDACSVAGSRPFAGSTVPLTLGALAGGSDAWTGAAGDFRLFPADKKGFTGHENRFMKFSAANSSIVTQYDTLPSDGTSAMQVTLTMKDTEGFPVYGFEGKLVSLVPAAGVMDPVPSTLYTNTAGQIGSTVKATTNGVKTISVQTPSSLASMTPATFTVIPLPAPVCYYEYGKTFVHPGDSFCGLTYSAKWNGSDIVLDSRYYQGVSGEWFPMDYICSDNYYEICKRW